MPLNPPSWTVATRERGPVLSKSHSHTWHQAPRSIFLPVSHQMVTGWPSRSQAAWHSTCPALSASSSAFLKLWRKQWKLWPSRGPTSQKSVSFSGSQAQLPNNTSTHARWAGACAKATECCQRQLFSSYISWQQAGPKGSPACLLRLSPLNGLRNAVPHFREFHRSGCWPLASVPSEECAPTTDLSQGGHYSTSS